MLAAITPSSSRDGDRHGEDVVHQQCTRDGESGLLAEVLGCHLVVPAARRVGVDVLAVRGDDHPEHHHHREGDPRRDRDGRETGERERQEDLVRGVRHGRERVGGEHRQCDAFRQQGVTEHVRPHRPPEDQPFESIADVRHDYTC